MDPCDDVAILVSCFKVLTVIVIASYVCITLILFTDG